MGYTWQWYDRQTGQLHNNDEPGTPCVCQGDDLPHPPRLCRAIRARLQQQQPRMCWCGAGGVGGAHVHGTYLGCPPLDIVAHFA
jgi:hypothetical protein